MRNLFIVGVILLSGLFCSRSYAADRFFTGSLSLETPVGMTPNRPQDNSPMALGSLKLHNVLPHINLFASGQLQWKSGLPYSKENKALVGLEYELSHGFTIYGYTQKWYDINDVRYVAGIRYDFKSARF